MTKHTLHILSVLSLLIYSTIAASESLTSQQQFLASVAKLQALMPKFDSSDVVTGSQQLVQSSISQQYDDLNFRLNVLIGFISNNKKPVNSSGLKWASPSDKNALFNAVDSANTTVNICHAEFIGASPVEKAVYPGQLMSAGCQISYAGYAFIKTDYQVLAGNSEKVQWMPVADIRKLMDKANPAPQAQASASIPGMMLQPGMANVIEGRDRSLITFLTSLQPDSVVPQAISGGFEGGKSVFICRANYENAYKIGKLISYQDQTYQLKDACDIGVKDKEIVIKDNFDLLMLKK